MPRLFCFLSRFKRKVKGYRDSDDQSFFDRSSYEETFLAFSDICEKWLKRSICVFFTLMLAAQLLLQFAAVRQVLQRVEALEGLPYRIHMEKLAEK